MKKNEIFFNAYCQTTQKKWISNYLIVPIFFTSCFFSIAFSQAPYLIKDLAPDRTDGVNFNMANATFKDKLYFSGNPNFNEGFLHVTDGKVQNISRFAENIVNEKVVNLTATANKLFIFTESDLFVSDGTVAGTQKVTSVLGLKIKQRFVLDKNRIVFTAKSSIATSSPVFSQIWISDGTASGTSKINDGFDFGEDGSSKDKFSYFKNQIIIFSKFGSTVKAAIITDGSQNGTKSLITYLETVQKFTDITNVASTEDLIAISGQVTLNGQSQSKDYITDGTLSGTTECSISGDFQYLNKLNDSVYTALANNYLYAYNMKSKSFTGNSIVSDINSFTAPFSYKGKLYFSVSKSAPNFTYDSYMWESNGTVSGSKQISNLGKFRLNLMPLNAGDSVFYIGNDNSLMMIDLKTKTEREITKVYSDMSGVSIEPIITVINNKLVFSKYTSVLGTELWAFNLNVASSLNNALGIESIKVHPNPATNYLNVALEKNVNANFVISNSVGQIIQHGTVNQNSQISLEALSSGLYFINIQTEGKVGTAKFIKQ